MTSDPANAISMSMQSVLFSMIQYNRAMNASLWTQELLDAKHMG